MRNATMICLLACMLWATGSAQTELTPAGMAASQPQDAIPGSLMNLEFITVADSRSRSQVFDMLNRLYGRRVRVAEGKSVRSVSNIQEFGESVVLYDTKEMIKTIKETVVKLGAAQKKPEVNSDSELVVREYKPRFISINDAHAALEPFMRDIDIGPQRGAGPRSAGNHRQTRRNVTILNERGLVIMRDTSSHLDKMMNVLTSIDLPKTQFMVSCMLIQGSNSVDANKIDDERLKRILPSELRDISPYKNFQMVSSGVIRVAAGSGKRVTLSMSGSGQVTANLMFSPTSFDPKTGTLGLGDVSVDFRKTAPNGTRTQQSFGTTTTIQMNDYVVIGAFGDNPVFAVLHLIPVK